MKTRKTHKVFKEINSVSIELLGEFNTYAEARRFAYDYATKNNTYAIYFSGPGYSSNYNPGYPEFYRDAV